VLRGHQKCGQADQSGQHKRHRDEWSPHVAIKSNMQADACGSASGSMKLNRAFTILSADFSVRVHVRQLDSRQPGRDPRPEREHEPRSQYREA
jgi:hypothetical protein